ncbi:hypothetical protein MGALJ_04350 [Mycobacterium gallinarum]|uniref:Uncharacterized protein n=1 Tax=Mycobacterium gallinarum TaxID=39689 RepID=A0A9W4AYH4_9MYCO|nr:hypothetical protein [Mycobacterium gallinarum]BBY90766.1 hypothetical protein MGALJ_04350 [Mycobacterium gallinarum]
MDLGLANSAATDLVEHDGVTGMVRCVRSALPLLRKAPFLVSRNLYLTGANVNLDGGSDFTRDFT